MSPNRSIPSPETPVFQGVTNLRFHFNASRNILVPQRNFRIRAQQALPKTDELTCHTGYPGGVLMGTNRRVLDLPCWAVRRARRFYNGPLGRYVDIYAF